MTAVAERISYTAAESPASAALCLVFETLVTYSGLVGSEIEHFLSLSLIILSYALFRVY